MSKYIVQQTNSKNNANQKTETNYEWLGHGWLNKANKNSKMAGENYINITLDRDIKEINFPNDKSVKLHLYPNKKRPNKADADFRLVLLTPAE